MQLCSHTCAFCHTHNVITDIYTPTRASAALPAIPAPALLLQGFFKCGVCCVLKMAVDESETQTRKRFKRTLFIRTKHKHAILGGNPFYQATKRHLKNN